MRRSAAGAAFIDQIRFYPMREAKLAQIRRDFLVGRHQLRTAGGHGFAPWHPRVAWWWPHFLKIG